MREFRNKYCFNSCASQEIGETKFPKHNQITDIACKSWTRQVLDGLQEYVLIQNKPLFMV